MGPIENDVKKLVELHQKNVTRMSQLDLLRLVVRSKDLQATKIISSVNPKIGKVFSYEDLEEKKCTILQEARKKLLDLSILEGEREISTNYKKS